MQKLYLILAAIATITVSTPHSLPARSNPMMALGVLGVGGFGYKFLGAWREMQELKQQLEEFPSPRNKAAYEEAREEFMEVKAQLGKTRLRLILHALGTLASATILAKGFYGTNNSTSVRGKFGSSSTRKKFHGQPSTQLTLQEEIQREKENNRTRGFNDSEATISLLQSALNTDASINPGRVDQLMTHVDPFAHEHAYGTDQRNARTALGSITPEHVKRHPQAFRQLLAKLTPQAHKDFVETQSTRNHYFWENTPLYKAAILEDEQAVDTLLDHNVAYDKLVDQYRATLLFKLAADYEKSGSIATRTRIIQKILNKYPSLLTHKDFGDFIYQKAEKSASTLRPWIDPSSPLMAQMRAPFEAEQQEEKEKKTQKEATNLLRTMRYADQISSADAARYRALGGNEEQLQEILHKKFMAAADYFTFNYAKARTILALEMSPLTKEEEEKLSTSLEFALDTSKYDIAQQLHSLGAHLSEARQQYRLLHLIKSIHSMNAITSVADVQRVVSNLGINVNAKNEHGKTALIEMVEQTQIYELRNAIQLQGIDINIQDNDGNTALVLAMKEFIKWADISREYIITTLLNASAQVDEKARALAHEVVVNAYAFNLDCGKELSTLHAMHGMNIDISKMSPQELRAIGEKKEFRAVYNLLKAGAPLTQTLDPIAADLFVYALRDKQDFDLATTLLDHIGDVHEVIEPLIAAVKSGHSDLAKATSLVKAIMKKNANVNMSGRVDTALIAALSITKPNESDDARLDYDTSMLSLLLDTYKANPNIATTVGKQTPLATAAHNGNVEAVKMLLEYGADVNQHSWSVQDTPLHRTVKPKTHDDYDFISGSYSQILAIAQKLLAAGAKKDALNKKGDTPYRLAMKNKALLDEAAQKEGQTDASELFALLKTAAGEEKAAEAEKLRVAVAEIEALPATPTPKALKKALPAAKVLLKSLKAKENEELEITFYEKFIQHVLNDNKNWYRTNDPSINDVVDDYFDKETRRRLTTETDYLDYELRSINNRGSNWMDLSSLMRVINEKSDTLTTEDRRVIKEIAAKIQARYTRENMKDDTVQMLIRATSLIGAA